MPTAHGVPRTEAVSKSIAIHESLATAHPLKLDTGSARCSFTMQTSDDNIASSFHHLEGCFPLGMRVI
jgi:hypothetical protein